jgi:outer membrane protein assembly factor BamD
VLAAANRFQGLTSQFPLFSKADEGLWQLAEAYHRAGDRFEEQQVAAYQKIVKDYPLSIHAEDARAQLMVMKRPVPEADPVAVTRMKYEMENRTRQGPLSHVLGGFSGHPNMAPAAKSGTPPMEGFRPTIPASVPVQAANPALGGDVTISQPGTESIKAVENAPDVRANAGAGTAPASTPADASSTASKAPDPNAVAQQATMTPAQQKKAYAAAVKQQQDAARKASSERRKREAQQAQLVKEQKKKSKQQQQDQQKQDKQPQTPPAPTGQGGAAPPKQ